MASAGPDQSESPEQLAAKVARAKAVYDNLRKLLSALEQQAIAQRRLTLAYQVLNAGILLAIPIVLFAGLPSQGAQLAAGALSLCAFVLNTLMMTSRTEQRWGQFVLIRNELRAALLDFQVRLDRFEAEPTTDRIWTLNRAKERLLEKAKSIWLIGDMPTFPELEAPADAGRS
jgi:hypothetical protein